VLEQEVELLHEQLANFREKVLESYPDSVDVVLLENWQLLAAIDALVGGNKNAANYHLSWFLALSETPVARVGRW
jgi:hypothetical protein